jgi:hypothetical protein
MDVKPVADVHQLLSLPCCTVNQKHRTQIKPHHHRQLMANWLLKPQIHELNGALIYELVSRSTALEPPLPP